MIPPELPQPLPSLADPMAPAASLLAVKAGGASMLVTILVRLAAVHVISIYAGIFAVIHWLRDVPLVETWTVGAVGGAMLFLAIGVMLTGRVLGYFSASGGGNSVDWMPPLLIWPMGLSIWGCMAIGIGSIQGHKDVADGMEMPLTMLAATLPPLFLGRLPPWPKPAARWQRLLDVHYVLATAVAAAALYLAMQSAITATAPAPTGQSAAAVPKSSGFACDPSKAGQGETDEEMEDNQCPSAPPTTPPTTAVAAELPLIDQNFSSWSCLWMLFSGAALVAGRALSARGRTLPSALVTGAMAQGLVAPSANGLVAAAGTQVASQAGSWLRNSGIPNADILADVVGNLLRPRGPSPAKTNMNPLPSAAPPPAPPAEPVAVPEAASPAAPAASASPSVPSVASVPPPVPEPSAPAPATESADTAKLKANVSGMAKTLSAQQDTTAKLQSAVGSLQDKLEQQAQVMTQMMAEAQQNAEESRRTIDSLTRLMQGMKGDLERLARNQAQ